MNNLRTYGGGGRHSVEALGESLNLMPLVEGSMPHFDQSFRLALGSSLSLHKDALNRRQNSLFSQPRCPQRLEMSGLGNESRSPAQNSMEFLTSRNLLNGPDRWLGVTVPLSVSRLNYVRVIGVTRDGGKAIRTHCD